MSTQPASTPGAPQSSGWLAPVCHARSALTRAVCANNPGHGRGATPARGCLSSPFALQMIVALGVVMTVPSNLFAADEQAGLETLYQLLLIRKSTRVNRALRDRAAHHPCRRHLGTVTALINATFTQQPRRRIGRWPRDAARGRADPTSHPTPALLRTRIPARPPHQPALLFGTAALVYLTANQIHLPQDRSWSLPMLLGCAVLAAAACYGISALVSYHWYRRREF